MEKNSIFETEDPNKLLDDLVSKAVFLKDEEGNLNKYVKLEDAISCLGKINFSWGSLMGLKIKRNGL